MPRSPLLHRFGLPPSRSRVRKLDRRFSPRQNCIVASGPQEVLDTLPSRLPNTTPSSFLPARCAFPTNDEPLSTDARQSIQNRSAACGLYEPRCPDFPSAGIFVGTLAPNRRPACREALSLLGFDALAEDAADAKGDFHDAQIDGKHSENYLNSRHFLKAMKSRQTLKTMATVLNHTVCGGSCGDERRTLWPA